jgi:hypothetical protein
VTGFGLTGMFIRWPLYGLALGSAAALILQQAALHVGPLRASQPFLVIVDPIVSIVLSVWLFEERFTTSVGVLATAVAGFAVMCGAVVLLTQTTPATMGAEHPDRSRSLRLMRARLSATAGARIQNRSKYSRCSQSVTACSKRAISARLSAT